MKSIEHIGLDWKSEISPEEFWKKYDAGEFGKPGLSAKPINTFNDPAFKKWEQEVRALPPERQVDAVAAKLQGAESRLRRPSHAEHRSRCSNKAGIPYGWHERTFRPCEPWRA